MVVKSNMMRSVSLVIFVLISSVFFSQSVEGKWYGVLSNNGIDQDVEFLIEKTTTNYQSTLVAPNLKLPSDSTFISDNKFYFRFANGVITCDGTYDSENMKGVFKQNGFKIPFTLTKNKPKFEEKTASIPSEKPQTPIGPFDYYTEEIEAFNSVDSVILSGTLTLPTNDGTKYPVVILVTGSSPQNRDSEILGHKSFAVIADHLAKQGIGSFRYDDRGVAKSTGTYAGSDLHDFYRDLDAVVQKISERKEVKKLGIAGHSEGGILAPWYASKHKKDIDFVILLAAPGMPIKDMMHLQRENLYEGMGMNKEFIQEQEYLFNNIDSLVINFSGAKKTEQLTNFLTNYLSEKGIAGDILQGELQKIMGKVDGAWYKSFVAINPEIYLKKVRCSVLAIGGGKDLQVPMDPNMKGIATSLNKSRSRIFRSRTMQYSTFGSLNHLMQPAETGLANEYGKIETTISRDVLFTMSDFINEL